MEPVCATVDRALSGFLKGVPSAALTAMETVRALLTSTIVRASPFSPLSCPNIARQIAAPFQVRITKKPQAPPPKPNGHMQSRAGSVSDVFKYNPWRAPGLAPVFDSCGMAGGAKVPTTAAAEYTSTVFARQGDLGSEVLKPRPSGTVWVRGSVATVRQQATAPHGGVS